MTQHNKLVQCKRQKCLFNKRIYVNATDTMQNCCIHKATIIRLDENGKCVYHPDKQ